MQRSAHIMAGTFVRNESYFWRDTCCALSVWIHFVANTRFFTYLCQSLFSHNENISFISLTSNWISVCGDVTLSICLSLVSCSLLSQRLTIRIEHEFLTENQLSILPLDVAHMHTQTPPFAYCCDTLVNPFVLIGTLVFELKR